MRNCSEHECQEWICHCIKTAYEDIREFSCNLHIINEKNVLKFNLNETFGKTIDSANVVLYYHKDQKKVFDSIVFHESDFPNELM